MTQCSLKFTVMAIVTVTNHNITDAREFSTKKSQVQTHNNQQKSLKKDFVNNELEYSLNELLYLVAKNSR